MGTKHGDQPRVVRAHRRPAHPRGLLHDLVAGRERRVVVRHAQPHLHPQRAPRGAQLNGRVLFSGGGVALEQGVRAVEVSAGQEQLRPRHRRDGRDVGQSDARGQLLGLLRQGLGLGEGARAHLEHHEAVERADRGVPALTGPQKRDLLAHAADRLVKPPRVGVEAAEIPLGDGGVLSAHAGHALGDAAAERLRGLHPVAEQGVAAPDEQP